MSLGFSFSFLTVLHSMFTFFFFLNSDLWLRTLTVSDIVFGMQTNNKTSLVWVYKCRKTKMKHDLQICFDHVFPPRR